MTLFEAIGLFLAAYLLLLCRSAWKQGELRQFLRSLVIVALLAAGIYGSVLAYNALSHP